MVRKINVLWMISLFFVLFLHGFGVHWWRLVQKSLWIFLYNDSRANDAKNRCSYEYLIIFRINLHGFNVCGDLQKYVCYEQFLFFP